MVLFGDVPDKQSIENISEKYKLKTGDLLHIRVSSLDKESVEIFNKQIGETSSQQYTPASLYIKSYVVDDSGQVQLPIIGNVEVEGKDISEAKEIITERMSEYYKYFSVDVKLVNFIVTVLGEVQSEGTLTIFQTDITLLQVLGKVGGFTDFADINHIVVARNVEGKSTFNTVDINSPEFFKSEFYFIQPSDMIYVRPLKPKRTRVNSTTIQLTLSAMTFILLVYNILTR